MELSLSLTESPAKQKYTISPFQTHYLSLLKVSLFVMVSFFPTADKFLPCSWAREPQISLDLHIPGRPYNLRETEFIFPNVEYLKGSEWFWLGHALPRKSQPLWMEFRNI